MFNYIDGSNAAFYISRNRKSRHWVIRLQAGGSCVMYSECYDRQKTAFGSSKPLQDYITGTFLTSDDPKINPTFHKWNKVFIPYCRYVSLLLIFIENSLSIFVVAQFFIFIQCYYRRKPKLN